MHSLSRVRLIQVFHNGNDRCSLNFKVGFHLFNRGIFFVQIWEYWELQANEVSSFAVGVRGWLDSFVFFAIVLVLMCVVARVNRIFLLIVYFSSYSHSFSSTCALYSTTSQIIIHLATNSAVNQAVVTFALCPRSRQLMMQNGLL